MGCCLSWCWCSWHSTFGLPSSYTFPPRIFFFFYCLGKLHQWCLHVFVNLPLLHGSAVSMAHLLDIFQIWSVTLGSHTTFKMQIWQDTSDLTPHPESGSYWLEPQQWPSNVVWHSGEAHNMWGKDIISHDFRERFRFKMEIRFIGLAGGKAITYFYVCTVPVLERKYTICKS